MMKHCLQAQRETTHRRRDGTDQEHAKEPNALQTDSTNHLVIDKQSSEIVSDELDTYVDEVVQPTSHDGRARCNDLDEI